MILIIDCGSKSALILSDIISQLNISFKIINYCQIYKINLREFSGIIIGGSPVILSENDLNHLQHFTKLIEYNKPILGVCFGHQVLGLLFGSKIHKTKKIKKKEKIKFLSHNSLFEGIMSDSEFFEDHCEHITLPKDYFLLAFSNSCENEAMKHKNKPFYGVQFHPEHSGKNGKKLLINFLKICNYSQILPK